MPDVAPGFDFAAKFHPLADLFPLMEGEDFAALVADIKANGLRTPIVELGNEILDGRNRYRACVEAGVPIRTEKFKDDNPLAFVMSANLHRRHLNESQRGMVAAKLESMKHGGDRRSSQDANLHLDRSDVAEMLNVSRRTVAASAAVRQQGTPELAKRVEAGEVAVSLAAKVAAMPKAQQAKLATASEAELRGATKKAARSTREQEMAEKTRQASASLGTTLYSVIYADPPWRFEPYSRETGLDRAADNHYPTLTVERICKIVPPAAKDCALFLWATAPMLREALSVIDAWGFTYKSHFIWAKDRVGTGYWARNRHELLLIATKGSIPAPAPGQQFESVIQASVAKHSEKPFVFVEMIEEMFPTARPLEMFARCQRAGWDSWGNEVEAVP